MVKTVKNSVTRPIAHVFFIFTELQLSTCRCDCRIRKYLRLKNLHLYFHGFFHKLDMLLQC